MPCSRFALVLVPFVAAAVMAGPSPVARAQSAAPQVKQGVAPITRPDSGAQMYKAYCAACHGADGKGHGPAAAALKTVPTDLTKLSANNGGRFPSRDVQDVLRVGSPLAAHGSADMPVWGQTFRQMDDEAIVTLRVSNLVTYLESLQGK